MAVLAWTPTSSATDLDKVWRIVQLQLQTAFNFMVEEWDILSTKIPRLRVNLSAREMRLPLDINEDYGVASIPEGGYESIPVSPNVVDATFTWITLHKRFSLSRTARHLDRGGNSAAMVMKQLRFQGMKAVQAIKRRVGDYFYGDSNATICKLAGVGGAPTYTLKDLYGVASLGGAADFARVMKVGDYVAILNPTGPALRGIDKITAITDSGTADFTLAGSVSGAAADDLVVIANSVEQASLTETDRARGMNGILAIGSTTTTLQSVNPATVKGWKAYVESGSSRFGTVELRAGKQAIANKGGGKLTDLIMSQGVENDMVAGLRPGLRFTDAFALEVDGSPTSKGVSMMSTQRVPPGWVLGFDRKNSIARIALLEGLDEPGWDDAEKVPNRAAFVFPIDWPLQMVTKNRANVALWTNKTTQ